MQVQWVTHKATTLWWQFALRKKGAEHKWGIRTGREHCSGTERIFKDVLAFPCQTGIKSSNTEHFQT